MDKIKDKDGVKFKYLDRTCNKCIWYPCIQNMNELKCDLAKYGCKDYKLRNS